jgi:hypothetical protein
MEATGIRKICFHSLVASLQISRLVVTAVLESYKGFSSEAEIQHSTKAGPKRNDVHEKRDSFCGDRRVRDRADGYSFSTSTCHTSDRDWRLVVKAEYSCYRLSMALLLLVEEVMVIMNGHCG